MEKIALSVKIPALGGTYDFIVPANMAVKDVQSLIVRILNSEYGVSDSVLWGKRHRQDYVLADVGLFFGLRLRLLS